MRVLFILSALNEKGSLGLTPRPLPYLTVSTATHLKRGGFHVKILDAFLEDLSFREIISRVDDYKPDIIAVPLSEINRDIPVKISLSLIQDIKEVLPHSIIISFGRQNIEFLREYFYRDDRIDYYIAGDPEETVLDLIALLGKGAEEEASGIRGLLYKNGSKVVFTGTRITDDINRLEPPDWDLIGLDRYPAVPHRYRNTKFYPIFETRGCLWGKCIFCQDGGSNEEPFRARSPEKITEEIIYARQKYGCEEIQFMGQQFNTDKNWLLSLESEFKKNKIDIRWSCLSRVDKVNPEVLSVMRRIGCWNILFGIESTNESLLKTINKGITLEQIRNAVSWCKNEGMEVTGSFLMGLPGEKPKDVYNNVSFACRMGIDYAQFFIAKWVNERSEFKNTGYLTDLCDFSQYDFGGRIFLPSAYKSIQHLKCVQRKAYRSFYFHPGMILKHLRTIHRFGDLKRLFIGARTAVYLLRRKRTAGQEGI
jgi:radical SAM superfamily enzyme YgiQ (UPF0313 family)